MISPYITNLLIMMSIFSILAVSLNLAIGFTGLLNLGHIAFFGIGAYTSAILTIDYNVPFVLAIILAGLFSSLFGYLLVLATKKLKGDYLALATLGFSFVIVSLLMNLKGLTRGPLGIPGIKKPDLLLFTIKSNDAYLVFSLIVAALSIFLIYKIVKSPFGRLLEASRDDDIGLRVLGKNTFALQYKSMMISAFFAGIAGSLFAHYISYIDPTGFTITQLILLLTIVIVGGLASVKGSIVATIIILLIPELLRFVSLPPGIIGPAREIIYSVILITILLFRPRGIFGRVDLE